MREDWTEKLRRKLEGHRKTPPAGLWDGISKEMELAAEPVSKPIVTKRWYWAAAVILVLVGFFVIYKMNDKLPPRIELSSLEPTLPQVKKPDFTKHEAPTAASVPTLAQTGTLHHIAKREDKEPLRKEAEPTTTESVTQEEKAVPQTSTSGKEDTPTQDRQIHQVSLQNSSEEWTMEQSSSASSQKLSLGINASGGLLAQNAHLALANNQAIQENPEAHYLTDYVSKHNLPIRFGLSLNYQLSPRLTLLSGISYTYLHSQFKMQLDEDVALEQKLHYLGIPLGLSCQLWSNRHFQVYVSGGVMLEKCLNDKPWQLSVDAAVGVEYTFTPQWGVYIEPSLGYYFDDGCALEHYYKAHPWVPTLECGLRLHLKH